ncbi:MULTISPECIES: TerD family protein [Rhodococcus]|uniref:TerD family protein n=1 Tax=Rhodococcus TaxID=1827 RepID=UPI0006901149|nr:MULTISPECIES: TerD family protein [Rhodococcus]MCJ0950396.1 TerD family protein [Rhodococcus sp. ARC_M8]UKO84721.1 TerD family protein [Rhodococcus erythropolis]ULD41815.1 TerD family protein [Rhodococcus qingshengii]
MTSAIRLAGDHRLPADHSWVVLDVETSGMRAASHRVLSIAALVLREDGSVEREFSTLLDPGCDPGPVHVHNLTPDRLAGAPRFEDIADEFGELLSGRTMVAHNASFDYGFLDAEFQRAGFGTPIEKRLCTLALSRRLELDVPNHRLVTLAEYWKIEQVNAHDAYDDARVLVEVFGRSASLAETLQLPLPVVGCKDRRATVHSREIKRVPSSFTNPGRLDLTHGLVQGMKIAISGPTSAPRTTLAARLTDAGFEFTNTVSRQTSVLVCDNTASQSSKVRKAESDGIPVISEQQLEHLLERAVPGEIKIEGASVGVSTVEPVPDTMTAPEVEVQREVVLVPEMIVSAQPRPDESTSGVRPSSIATASPLANRKAKAWQGRRVLILGGTHLDGVIMRSRILQLGARPSLNFTTAVTEVLVLEGGESDKRMARVTDRGLPKITESDVNEALVSGVVPAHMRLESRLSAPILMRGEVVDLPAAQSSWSINVAWRAENVGDEFDVDVVAFLLDGTNKVDSDQDFVFYNNTVDEDGAVELSVDGDSEQSVRADLDSLPAECQRVVIAAAVDGDKTFGDLGAVSVSIDGSDGTFATFVLDLGTVERTMVLAEIYRRGNVWRLRAVGQGHNHGLGAMAVGYGVEVDD